ncbi:hypothetical protein [Flavobacterium sp.]
MKKHFKLLVIAVLISFFANGQGYDRGSSISIGVRTPDRFYTKQNELIGSPFVNKVFWVAKVENIKGTVLMRYNAYNDEFEFLDEVNDTLVLLKNKTFENITFTAKQTNYRLVDYTDNKGELVKGYLILLLTKNGYTLYKRQKIIFNPEKPSKNTYDKGTPANFSAEKDVYYLKHNDEELVEFPTSKKLLLKHYPEKKELIEAFIKENKTSFGKDEDLIKLVNFLSS